MGRHTSKAVAAKIIVYAGESEQYFSYISQEAWQELTKWIQYRERSGEKMTEDSWLMRDYGIQEWHKAGVLSVFLRS